MIISSFLEGLFNSGAPRSEALSATHAAQVHQTRAALEAEIRRLSEDYKLAMRARSDAIVEMLTVRAQLRSAESEIIHLRAKLEAARPYLVAAAKGASLQAKGDLAALDAVLRSTKP